MSDLFNPMPASFVYNHGDEGSRISISTRPSGKNLIPRRGRLSTASVALDAYYIIRLAASHVATQRAVRRNCRGVWVSVDDAVLCDA